MRRKNPTYSRGTAFLKEPDRKLSTEEVAKVLHVTVESIRRWTRTSDIPHDVVLGFKVAGRVIAGEKLEKIARKKLLYDPQEVKLWYLSQQAAGKRLPRHSRIPLAEARARLKAVKTKLNISTDEFCKLLNLKRSTLTGYLFGARTKKLSAVPASIVANAEVLTEEDVPINLRRTPKSMVQNALVINKGRIGAAAESLGMHPTTFKKFALKYKLGHLLRGKPDFSSKITRKQLIAILQKHDGHIKSVAAELGVNRTTLYSLFRKAKIKPEDYRKGAHRNREEIKKALRKHGSNRALTAKELGINVEKLRQLIRMHRLKRYFPAVNAGLKPKEVKKILVQHHYSIARAAKKLGVTVSYLNKFVKLKKLRPTKLEVKEILTKHQFSQAKAAKELGLRRERLVTLIKRWKLLPTKMKVKEALIQNRFDKKLVSQKLGINLVVLQYLIKRWRLKPPKQLGRS